MAWRKDLILVDACEWRWQSFLFLSMIRASNFKFFLISDRGPSRKLELNFELDFEIGNNFAQNLIVDLTCPSE